MKSTRLIPVKVIALLEERFSHSPVVLLFDEENNRVLPIWIGDNEARAIMIALNHMNTPRPLTHQLITSVINCLKAKIEQIVIDRIENNTFYATINLSLNQERILIDARPSDAIAIGLQSNVHLLVSEDVMQEAGQENPLARDFIEEIADLESKKSYPIHKKDSSPPKLSEEELQKLKKLLEEARKREQNL